MHEAVRVLTKSNNTTPTVYVHNSKGLNVCSDTLKAETIKYYFHSQFTDKDDGPMPAFEGTPTALSIPITSEEVQSAVGKLKNGKSNGPDNIPNEVLKAWHPSCNEIYANILNE